MDRVYAAPFPDPPMPTPCWHWTIAWMVQDGTPCELELAGGGRIAGILREVPYG
jgi:hypothetical protein